MQTLTAPLLVCGRIAMVREELSSALTHETPQVEGVGHAASCTSGIASPDCARAVHT